MVGKDIESHNDHVKKLIADADETEISRMPPAFYCHLYLKSLQEPAWTSFKEKMDGKDGLAAIF